MRQGCISLGKVECGSCHKTIPYAGRYLLIDEEDGAEVESGERSCYCVDCSLEKGYGEYREEKGERVLTFFPAEAVQPHDDDADPVKGNDR